MIPALPSLRNQPGSRTGFTLIEILVATLAFAVLLAALHSVFFSALRLRRDAELRIQSVQSHHQVAQLIERDLRNGILTGGLLAESVLGESETKGRGRADRLELVASTGSVDDAYPFGDLQRIEYFVMDDTGWTNRDGRVLARAVERNLLATVREEPEPQILLRNVESFEVAYYDGSSWVTTWDSTVQEDIPPAAIRVLVRFVEDPTRRQPRPLPIEIVAPWSVTPADTGDESAGRAGSGSGGDDSGGPPPGNGGGTLPPGGGNPPPGGGRQ